MSRLSNYDDRGRKCGCAFCGSDTRACGFHRHDVARLRMRRAVTLAVLGFLIAAAAVIAAILTAATR